MRRAACAIAGALVLVCMTGCASNDPVKTIGEANVYPASPRPEILAFLRTYLNDPSNIRSAFVSEPALMTVGSTQRYGMCLRFDARKSGGEYEGSRDRVVYFLAGKLDTMVEARRGECKDAVYQPFPELEKLTR
jgi:hypothetical protein